MPWVEHFRFLKPFPEKMHYADGSIVLEIVQKPGAEVWEAGWIFQARKLNQAGTTCALHQARSYRELKIDLYDAGFPAHAQFIAPQRKIMERLCREGYAESGKLKLNGKTGLRM